MGKRSKTTITYCFQLDVSKPKSSRQPMTVEQLFRTLSGRRSEPKRQGENGDTEMHSFPSTFLTRCKNISPPRVSVGPGHRRDPLGGAREVRLRRYGRSVSHEPSSSRIFRSLTE
jgi:hypothetical protein